MTCLPLIKFFVSLSPSLTFHALLTSIAGPVAPWNARETSSSVRERGRVQCWQRKRGTCEGGKGAAEAAEGALDEESAEAIGWAVRPVAIASEYRSRRRCED